MRQNETRQEKTGHEKTRFDIDNDKSNSITYQLRNDVWRYSVDEFFLRKKCSMKREQNAKNNNFLKIVKEKK